MVLEIFLSNFQTACLLRTRTVGSSRRVSSDAATQFFAKVSNFPSWRPKKKPDDESNQEATRNSGRQSCKSIVMIHRRNCGSSGCQLQRRKMSKSPSSISQWSCSPTWSSSEHHLYHTILTQSLRDSNNNKLVHWADHSYMWHYDGSATSSLITVWNLWVPSDLR